MSDTKETIIGAEALLNFAAAKVRPEVVVIPDPANIAEPISAVVGIDRQGEIFLQQINHSRDAYRERPIRRRGQINVTALESFVALVNRDSGEDSVIFADDGVGDEEPQPSLTAVLNFHPTGGEDAAWCDDRIVYSFPLSDEWKAWQEKDKESMSVGEFAEFIENRLFDIAEPGSAGAIAAKFAAAAGVDLAGPQAIRSLSKGLSVRVEHRVAKTVNLQSGEGRIEFSEEHTDEGGGALKVPAAFHILIPVFHGGALYSIPVRLRYRTSGGRVTFFYELHRADLFMLDAISDALKIVKALTTADPPGCGLPVYMGSSP